MLTTLDPADIKLNEYKITVMPDQCVTKLEWSHVRRCVPQIGARAAFHILSQHFACRVDSLHFSIIHIIYLL